jgi:hypothetical protein
LDNQSTADVFCNQKPLDSVRKVNKVMNINCNAGVTRTDMVGDLPGCGEVWFNKSGIANILLPLRMEKKHRITCDSENGKQFIVHKENGMVRRFRQSEDGLFCMDAKESDEEQDGTVLVNKVKPVEGNKKNFTKAACKQATLARKLRNIIGRPSARSFLNIAEKNCPFTREDALTAEDIFGPNVRWPKGKTVRQNGERVRPECEDIPKHIMERHQDITPCIDLMHINKIPFLVTILRHIKFGTIEAVKSRHHKVPPPAIKNVKRLHALRGFRVRHCHVDNEFEGMRHELMELGMQLNVVAEAEQVPEIERHVRTIKERTRCVCNTVPFKRMPARMTIEMAHASVFWLNMFPASDCVSGDLSP